MKNVEYCAVLEQNDFVLVPVGKWVVIASHGLEIEQLSHTDGRIKFWRHSKFYSC